MIQRELGVTYAAITWRTERWASIAALANICHSAVSSMSRMPETIDKNTNSGRPVSRLDPIDECKNQ